LVEEGVREETITILIEKGVTVSGFLLDRSTLKAGEKYVPYEERRIVEGIKCATTVKGIDIPMTKEKAENLEPQTFEEPPLLQITLKDINSIPEVIHKGESLKGLINIGFNWETSGPDEFGSVYINMQNADVVSKYPNEKRTQYKRGKALNELPTKDDLFWDKERGIYILPKGNMK